MKLKKDDFEIIKNINNNAYEIINKNNGDKILICKKCYKKDIVATLFPCWKLEGSNLNLYYCENCNNDFNIN